MEQPWIGGLQDQVESWRRRPCHGFESEEPRPELDIDLDPSRPVNGGRRKVRWMAAPGRCKYAVQNLYTPSTVQPLRCYLVDRIKRGREIKVH